MDKIIHTSNLKNSALKAGEPIWLSGFVYTARDAAHKRLFALLESGAPLPFEINDSIIYYAGPANAPPGKIIGSCGPTTSGRMDAFAPTLYDMGMAASIGKGGRSEEVIAAIKRSGGLYLAAVGGAGALLASCVTGCETVAFEELGCEAVRRLEIVRMPLFVAIDSHGGNIYERP